MKKTTIILIAVVSIGLGFLPAVIKDNSTLTILSNVLLYVALASSWNILGGFAGQISLGHSAFFGLGSLVTRLLWFAGWPLLVAMFLGGIVAVLFALIIGYPAFKL